jgi:hypothetical protein
MGETLAVYQRIADSAVGHASAPIAAMEKAASRDVWVSRAKDRRAGAISDDAALSPRELVSSARGYLAQADARLQQSLPFL